jgi:hypothetical protein
MKISIEEKGFIGRMVDCGHLVQEMPSFGRLKKHGTVKDSFGKLSEGIPIAW